MSAIGYDIKGHEEEVLALTVAIEKAIPDPVSFPVLMLALSAVLANAIVATGRKEGISHEEQVNVVDDFAEHSVELLDTVAGILDDAEAGKVGHA